MENTELSGKELFTNELILSRCEDVKYNDSSLLYIIKYGSRTYNTHNDDSDYDVRGIYLFDIDRYLGMYEPKDILERKLFLNADVTLFDVNKFFKLLSKSNPMTLEWILSSEQLFNQLINFSELKENLSKYYNRKTLFYHYLSMAKSDFNLVTNEKRGWVKGPINIVRELICSELVLENIIPPTNVNDLVKLSNNKVLNELLIHLVNVKKNMILCEYTNDQLKQIMESSILEISNKCGSNIIIQQHHDSDQLNNYLTEYLIEVKRGGY